MSNTDDQRLVRISLVFATLFTILPWIIFIIEFSLSSNLNWLGIYPRTWSGLWGILTSPFIHGDLGHLANNSPSIFIGVGLIIYYYRSIAFEAMGAMYLLTGIMTWIMAREAYHIGASGFIYAMMSFLFFSGIFRKNKNLMAVALTVTVINSGIIWSALPIVKDGISWESHLMGLAAGFLIALYYLNRGPDNDLHYYEIKEKEEDDYWEYQSNTHPYLWYYDYEERDDD